jgi:hypothetical protein
MAFAGVNSPLRRLSGGERLKYWHKRLVGILYEDANGGPGGVAE